MSNKSTFACKIQDGILNQEKHGRLISNLDRYALNAGLGQGNQHFIWNNLENYGVGENEKSILKNINSLAATGKNGILYFGCDANVIIRKMMAITGCLLRNYIPAKYAALENVLDEYQQNKYLDVKLVCIPNFSSGAQLLPNWRLSLLVDMVIQHFSTGRYIIGYVDNVAMTRQKLPTMLTQMLQDKLIPLGGKL